jgi:NAD(P)-dependent dehydrogenase (short-subunit alcohol dehydrogenase family)
MLMSEGQRNEGKVCAVVGVGPGNGESLVRRFAEEGYRVAAMARHEDKLEELVGGIAGVEVFGCDATDEASVDGAFDRVVEQLGEVDTLLYNAGTGVWGKLMEVEADDLEMSWKVNTLGLFHCARKVVPAMLDNGGGTIGVTGATAAMRGKPFTTAFAQAKGAQRMLAESMARELSPKNIHVFYYVVDGVIDSPRTREMMSDKSDEFFLKPDDIAEAVCAVAHQPRSAWTFQLDLRPFGEEW